MRSLPAVAQLGVSALVFLAAFGFYLAGASPSIAARDCADMAAAALTLGVAHPPGYPLYSVLGHFWLTLFPFGNPAYRLAVLSCLTGAGAVSFLFASVRRRGGAGAGFAAAGLLVFSAPLWKFALIQEKYALHALIVSVLFYLSEGGRDSFWRRARLSGFLVGLGLVNHQSLLLLLPGLLLLWRAECRRVDAELSRVLAAVLPWALAGLSLYAFLWVRIGSLRAALDVLLRTQYGSGTLSAELARPLTPARTASLFVWSLKTWALSVGVPGAVAAAYGAYVLRRTERDLGAGLLLGALGAGPLFVILAGFDVSGWVARSVLEPAFLVPAFVAAVFAGVAVSGLGRFAAPACLALAASGLLLRAPVPDRRDDFLAFDYARNLRRAVPPGGSLLAAGDTALFGLRWLELTSPRTASLDLAGAGMVDPRSWLAEKAGRPGVFVTGLPPGTLPAGSMAPEGLVQRVGAGRPPAPLILRRSASWQRDESYARDAKLTYAFAAWSSARLLEARGLTAPEALDLTAVSLDPEDYRLE